ncbi:hypothetical protein BpHYR1_033312 [Brachionus plicatilis]|uniref:Uncharacterized protein n=1 Tax=Brachionus plicatilis TaxID=10195 RepID=A0A3M7SJW2_BRAPC|nr:hypothetical protein BpHYR1_033312 [Brachionus plicatilis]
MITVNNFSMLKRAKAINDCSFSKTVIFFHGFDRNKKEFFWNFDNKINKIGTIKSKKENYEIFDEKGNVILEIECISSFCSYNEFKLLTANEKNEIGRAIYICIIPIDLSVKTKEIKLVFIKKKILQQLRAHFLVMRVCLKLKISIIYLNGPNLTIFKQKKNKKFLIALLILRQHLKYLDN